MEGIPKKLLLNLTRVTILDRIVGGSNVFFRNGTPDDYRTFDLQYLVDLSLTFGFSNFAFMLVFTAGKS